MCSTTSSGPVRNNKKFTTVISFLAVVVLLVVAGLILRQSSRAATPFLVLQPEGGNVVAPAAIVNDSAGSYLKFQTQPTVSGQAMPVGNLTGWKQTYAEDFHKSAAIGQFQTAYSTSWCGYNESGKYFNSKVLSAHDDQMDFTLDGTIGGAGWFCINGDRGGQLYSRFSLRHKAVAAADNGTAIMVWPNSNIWGDGEIDYPEGNFNQTLGLFHHGMNCTDCSAADGLDTGASWQDWHTTTVEWMPGVVRYYLDGKLIKTVTHDVPITNHRYTIQMAPNGPNPQPGHFLIDWAVMYSPS